MNELSGKYNEINNLKINEIVGYFNTSPSSPDPALTNWESIQSKLLDVPRRDQKETRGYCRTNMYKYSDDHSGGNSISNYLIRGGNGAANPSGGSGGVKGTGYGGWLGGPDYGQVSNNNRFNHAWQDSHNVGKWTANGLERNNEYGAMSQSGGDPGYKYIWAQTQSEAQAIINEGSTSGSLAQCTDYGGASQLLHDCTYNSEGGTATCSQDDVAGRTVRFNFCCGCYLCFIIYFII